LIKSKALSCSSALLIISAISWTFVAFYISLLIDSDLILSFLLTVSYLDSSIAYSSLLGFSINSLNLIEKVYSAYLNFSISLRGPLISFPAYTSVRVIREFLTFLSDNAIDLASVLKDW